MANIWSDLKSHQAIIVKGILFLALGLLSAAMLLVFAPDWKVGLLLAISIWAFCRFYYFAFYVIEHYVDHEYKFAGLISFLRYLCQRKTQDRQRSEQDVQSDSTRAGAK